MDWKIGLLAEMDLVRSELRALFTKKATVVQRSLGVLERMKEGDLEVIGWGVGKLQRDSVMQGALSEGVVDAVTRKCWRRRWVGSGSGGQGVEMRRFVGFVVGRYALPFLVFVGILIWNVGWRSCMSARRRWRGWWRGWRG